MKVERFDGSFERRILALFIYSDIVLDAVAKIWDKRPNLLRSSVENAFLEWCIKFYRENHKAPQGDISWILESFSDSHLRDELEALVNSLPRINPSPSLSLYVGEVGRYFDKIALERTAKTVLARLSQDDVDGGVDALNQFSRVSIGVSTNINPFTDEAALIETFSDDSCNSLLTFDHWEGEDGDDARAFFGDTFSRSSFVVFNAPEKGCKSATLLEFAVIALREGRKVAYFEAGDMSRPQVFRRLYQRVSEHPRRARPYLRPKPGGEFAVKKHKDDGPTIHIELEEKSPSSDLSISIAKEALAKWNAEHDMVAQFRFSEHPQDLTVPRICSQLDEWEREDGFKPDFVIIDYADLLQPVIKNEFRHQINDTFGRLRALSLDRKCCLITATQAKGAAYNAETQSRALISEDKRKAAYPTAMIGLASTEDEREKQVYHMNYILRRDDPCSESMKLYFAQCLAVCNPMVRCYLPENHKSVSDMSRSDAVEDAVEYSDFSEFASDDFDDDSLGDDEAFTSSGDKPEIKMPPSYSGERPRDFHEEPESPVDDVLDWGNDLVDRKEPVTFRESGGQSDKTTPHRFSFPPAPDLSDSG